MALIPWRHKHSGGEVTPAAGFRHEMDRLFDSFFREPFGWFGERGGMEVWYPSVDVEDSEKEVTVRAEVPGVAADDINLTIADNTLTISGEKKEESERKGEGFYHRERHFGSFERQFALPEGVDTDKIEAKFKKGVLTVTLPKKPEAIKPEKKIEVKAS